MLCFYLPQGPGYGAAYVVTTSSTVRYFPNFYGHVIQSVVLSGVGTGSAVYPYIYYILEEEHGWRGALLITAGITLHVLVFGMLLRNPDTLYEKDNAKMGLKTLG